MRKRRLDNKRKPGYSVLNAMANNVNNPADGKFVVVENGQRVTAPLDTKAQADAEANKRNKIAESNGTIVPENRRAQVKQNLFGAILILLTLGCSTLTPAQRQEWLDRNQVQIDQQEDWDRGSARFLRSGWHRAKY
jgi:hypothetical protein